MQTQTWARLGCPVPCSSDIHTRWTCSFLGEGEYTLYCNKVIALQCTLNLNNSRTLEQARLSSTIVYYVGFVTVQRLLTCESYFPRTCASLPRSCWFDCGAHTLNNKKYIRCPKCCLFKTLTQWTHTFHSQRKIVYRLICLIIWMAFQNVGIIIIFHFHILRCWTLPYYRQLYHLFDPPFMHNIFEILFIRWR